MPASTAIVITHEVIDFIPTLLGVGIKGQKSITVAKSALCLYESVGFLWSRGWICLSAHAKACAPRRIRAGFFPVRLKPDTTYGRTLRTDSDYVRCCLADVVLASAGPAASRAGCHLRALRFGGQGSLRSTS